MMKPYTAELCRGDGYWIFIFILFIITYTCACLLKVNNWFLEVIYPLEYNKKADLSLLLSMLSVYVQMAQLFNIRL